MDKKDDRFWKSFGGTIRKALNNCPLTPDQAQKELEMMKDYDAAPFTRREVEDSIDKVLSGDLDPEEAAPDLSWTQGLDTSAVGEGVFALNRNRGEDDAEVDARVDELRKKALDEEQSDEDEPGLEGGAKPPSKGG